jgi:hypothetical protein
VADAKLGRSRSLTFAESWFVENADAPVGSGSGWCVVKRKLSCKERAPRRRSRAISVMTRDSAITSDFGDYLVCSSARSSYKITGSSRRSGVISNPA